MIGSHIQNVSERAAKNEQTTYFYPPRFSALSDVIRLVFRTDVKKRHKLKRNRKTASNRITIDFSILFIEATKLRIW
ncbi:osjnba0071g03.9 protein [Echinococcus multilocularis]|uniref:Osjnba0071g03.9 protein n=1 Tax=Echinococcus multilocularis TaxID=6211 RepID=A0A087W2N3_ECHMU|nr:osjnba0071g03.9 protein [Echinococcus multilocularis]